MEELKAIWAVILEWGSVVLFNIGNTPVTFFRLSGLVLILILAWWGSRFIERSVFALLTRKDTNKLVASNIYTVTRILRYLILIIGVVIGLNYLGFSLASLAFLGGVIGVGIGFGLQNIFSNFISGIIILLEKTLKVGDFVDLQSGVVGRVMEIGMRYTRVTTPDLVDIVVPNSEFIDARVTNWSFNERTKRMHIPFGVAYGTDKELVRKVVIEAARRVDGTIESQNRKIEVWLVEFGDSSLNFELVVWVETELLFAPAKTTAKYLWEIETSLSENAIEIPFPQRDLNLRTSKIHVALDEAGRPPEQEQQKTDKQ